MSLQISIFGIAIIAALYAIAALVLVPLWLRSSSPVPRALVILLGLVALVLPWAEEMWISSRFGELCNDAGVHVKRSVTVDGFLYSLSSFGSAATIKPGPIGKMGELADFEKRGYRFRENQLGDGNVWHLEREGDQLVASVLKQPMARYHYRVPVEDVPIGHRLTKTEYQVVDGTSGEVLGRRTIYKRFPNTVEGLWTRLLGTGMTMCPDPETGPPQPPFPEAVLRPINGR